MPPSNWQLKQTKLADKKFEQDLQTANDDTTKDQATSAAMGGGDKDLFEKKLTKEEKKARAKAAREAKKKAKKGDGGDEEDEEDAGVKAAQVLAAAREMVAGDGDLSREDDGIDFEQTDALASAGTICTFSSSRKGVDARSRDINVQNFSLQHMGAVLLDESQITLNHGNRYGLLGRNGCGKSTLLRALGARAVPIPRGIDIFYLSEEIEPSDTVTALDAVMSVDGERLRLEKHADELNHILAELAESASTEDSEDGKTPEEQQEEIMEALNSVYERLDALDAATAEVRARSILKGLGFTHEMQGKFTRDFSGGWRMRVSLARALFIQPVCLLLDEPTNHLDMEAVIWLEDYLSRWNRILLLISHSQDFLNNVCSHMIHFTNRKKLEYYVGNYDGFMKTKSEKEENQWKQYKWEQEQIKSMKEYVAKFGHGTSKNARQAQSKEKVLAKMVRAGLTDKPEEEKPLNFRFSDPGHLPPPVLSFYDVKFGYPGCEPLYSNVSFGVDLDSRVALVGPNGAGKTTLIKLMCGSLQPTSGDIRPHGHLKLGRFTQHFVDVLDLERTPLEFFEENYPQDTRDEQRKILGRFGVSGARQVQKMAELSDGQKSRVVFAKLGRDVPHILLLDEPTNHLDMESIDALAKAINEFKGGMVLVSHDMRLIGQTAREIWICDDKTITKHVGDIQSFKMDMRAQMGIDGEQQSVKLLRGDMSVKQKEGSAAPAPAPKKPEPKLEVIAPPAPAPAPRPVSLPVAAPPAPAPAPRFAALSLASPAKDDATAATVSASSTTNSEKPASKYVPMHLREKAGEDSGAAEKPRSRYVPPHLRK